VHGAGGNFEDPPYRVVPDPHRLGFPFAELDGDGNAVVTKLPGTGGAVDARTTKTQLYYEIHDPARYLTPDVTADFSAVTVEEIGPDRVRVAGARGTARPDTLKVLVGVDFGWRGVGEFSYAGPGCVERARRGIEILRHRLEAWTPDIDDLRIDLQGIDSLLGDRLEGGYPAEVRLRLALRSRSIECVKAAVYEVEYLYFGPAGGGGAVTTVAPALAVTPAYVPRDRVPLTTTVVTS
jgi:hypothetical protein